MLGAQKILGICCAPAPPWDDSAVNSISLKVHTHLCQDARYSGRLVSQMCFSLSIVVLTLTGIIKSGVTGQAPLTLDSRVEEYPRAKKKKWYTYDHTAVPNASHTFAEKIKNEIRRQRTYVPRPYPYIHFKTRSSNRLHRAHMIDQRSPRKLPGSTGHSTRYRAESAGCNN